MADEFNEELIEELEPVDPGEIDPEEALDISDAELEGDADAELLIEPEPQPLGQTIAWDFENHTRLGTRGHGPHMVRGEAALRQWIDKCLRTHAGAHPIHPDGYGMAIPISDFIGQPISELEIAELEDTVRDALAFHPAIKDVTDFDATFREEDLTGSAALELHFVVVKDDETSVRIDTEFSAEGLAEAAVV